MKSFKEDMKNGLEGEEETIRQLKTKYENIKKLGKYCVYDFETENNLIELKTRTNSRLKYETTLIPLNKWENRLKDKYINKEVIFMFKFTDGLYYISCNDLKEGDNFDINYFKRRKRVDFEDKRSKYLFIKVDCLKQF